jgi:hypothetical protein
MVELKFIDILEDTLKHLSSRGVEWTQKRQYVVFGSVDRTPVIEDTSLMETEITLVNLNQFQRYDIQTWLSRRLGYMERHMWENGNFGFCEQFSERKFESFILMVTIEKETYFSYGATITLRHYIE